MKTEIKDLIIDKSCVIGGFIDTFREQKTMFFVILHDKSGKIQIAIDKIVQKDAYESLAYLLKGSYVYLQGKMVTAENVIPEKVEFLVEKILEISSSKESPIDENSSQILKLQYRWLDLRTKKNQLIFEIRTFVENAMREYFVSKNYTEIHTPKITAQCSEGGAEVFGLEFYGQKAYLAQSPQFYKQMAISAGFEKVFEIGEYFRAERSFTPRHTSEATCIDVEIADIFSHHEIMKIEQDWILSVLKSVKEKYGEIIKKYFNTDIELVFGDIPKIKLSDVFKIFKDVYNVSVPEVKQLDLDPEAEKLICDYARDYLKSDFVFITDYPLEARAFYTRKKNEQTFDSMSFDLLYRGWELSSGAMRENRYDVLASQVEDKGISKEKMSAYLDFFKYGCPLHGGFGFGIDRFIAKLLDLPSLKESTFIFRGPSNLLP